MTMSKVRISDQSGSSRSDMVARSSEADLMATLGDYAMSLGDEVNQDILTALVADISENWTPGYGGMSRKEKRLAKKKFAEDEGARNEYIGAVDDLRRDGSKDAERQMKEETTAVEKDGDDTDVLDVNSLVSFPSLTTTGSQTSADDIAHDIIENKKKNTCIDDDMAKGTSTVPTGELKTAGVNQLKVDTPVDTSRVKGEYVLVDDLDGWVLSDNKAKDGDDAAGDVANIDVSIATDGDDTSAASVVSEAGSKRKQKARAYFERKKQMKAERKAARKKKSQQQRPSTMTEEEKSVLIEKFRKMKKAAKQKKARAALQQQTSISDTLYLEDAVKRAKQETKALQEIQNVPKDVSKTQERRERRKKKMLMAKKKQMRTMEKEMQKKFAVLKNIMSDIEKMENKFLKVKLEKDMMQVAVRDVYPDPGDDDSAWTTISDDSSCTGDTMDGCQCGLAICMDCSTTKRCGCGLTDRCGCGLTDKEKCDMIRADMQENKTETAYLQKQLREESGGDENGSNGGGDENGSNDGGDVAIPAVDTSKDNDDAGKAADLHSTNGTSNSVSLEFSQEGDILRVAGDSVEVILDPKCRVTYGSQDQAERFTTLELNFETILHNLHRLRVNQEDITNEIKALQAKIPTGTSTTKSKDPPSNEITAIYQATRRSTPRKVQSRGVSKHLRRTKKSRQDLFDSRSQRAPTLRPKHRKSINVTEKVIPTPKVPPPTSSKSARRNFLRRERRRRAKLRDRGLNIYGKPKHYRDCSTEEQLHRNEIYQQKMYNLRRKRYGCKKGSWFEGRNCFYSLNDQDEMKANTWLRNRLYAERPRVVQREYICTIDDGAGARAEATGDVEAEATDIPADQPPNVTDDRSTGDGIDDGDQTQSFLSSLLFRPFLQDSSPIARANADNEQNDSDRENQSIQDDAREEGDDSVNSDTPSATQDPCSIMLLKAKLQRITATQIDRAVDSVSEYVSAANIIRSMTELSAINERLNIFEDLLEQEPYSSSDYIPTIKAMISETRDIILKFERKYQPRLDCMENDLSDEDLPEEIRDLLRDLENSREENDIDDESTDDDSHSSRTSTSKKKDDKKIFASLVQKLMKQKKNLDPRQFDIPKQLVQRRSMWKDFIQNLKLIVICDDELEQYLSNYPQQLGIISNEHERALYQMIYTLCGRRARLAIQDCTTATEALEELKTQCAQQTAGATNRLLGQVLNCTRFHNETPSSFIQRLKVRYANLIREMHLVDTDCTASTLGFLNDPSYIVDLALRGLGSHPKYDPIIETYRTRRYEEENNAGHLNGSRLTLDILERHFLAVDEDAAFTTRGSGQRTGRELARTASTSSRPSGNYKKRRGDRFGRPKSGQPRKNELKSPPNGTRRFKHNNFSQKKTTNPKISCYICGENHYASQCPQQQSNNNSTQRRNKKCIHCGKHHRQSPKDCPNKQSLRISQAADSGGPRRESICMVTMSGDQHNRLQRSTSTDSLYDDLPTSVPITQHEEAIVARSFRYNDRVQIYCPESPLLHDRCGTVASRVPVGHTCLVCIDNDGTRPDVDAPQPIKIWHLRLILNGRPEPAQYLAKKSVSYRPGDKVTVDGYGPGTIKSNLMIHPDYTEGAHYVSIEKNEFIRVEICGRNSLHPPFDDSNNAKPSDESSVVSDTKPSQPTLNFDASRSRKKKKDEDEYNPNNNRFAPDKFDWQTSHTLMYMSLSKHDEVEPTMEPCHYCGDQKFKDGSHLCMVCFNHAAIDYEKKQSSNSYGSERCLTDDDAALYSTRMPMNEEILYRWPSGTRVRVAPHESFCDSYFKKTDGVILHNLSDYANESYRVRWILEGKAIYKHLHRKDLVIQSSEIDVQALTIRTDSTTPISDDDSSMSSAEIDDSPRLQTPLWMDDKAIVEHSLNRENNLNGRRVRISSTLDPISQTYSVFLDEDCVTSLTPVGPYFVHSWNLSKLDPTDMWCRTISQKEAERRGSQLYNLMHSPRHNRFEVGEEVEVVGGTIDDDGTQFTESPGDSPYAGMKGIVISPLRLLPNELNHHPHGVYWVRLHPENAARICPKSTSPIYRAFPPHQLLSPFNEEDYAELDRDLDFFDGMDFHFDNNNGPSNTKDQQSNNNSPSRSDSDESKKRSSSGSESSSKKPRKCSSEPEKWARCPLCGHYGPGTCECNGSRTSSGSSDDLYYEDYKLGRRHQPNAKPKHLPDLPKFPSKPQPTISPDHAYTFVQTVDDIDPFRAQDFRLAPNADKPPWWPKNANYTIGQCCKCGATMMPSPFEPNSNPVCSDCMPDRACRIGFATYRNPASSNSSTASSSSSQPPPLLCRNLSNLSDSDSSGYSYSESCSDDDAYFAPDANSLNYSINSSPGNVLQTERESKELLLFKNEFVFQDGEWHFNDSDSYKRLQSELEALIDEESSDLDSLTDNIRYLLIDNTSEDENSIESSNSNNDGLDDDDDNQDSELSLHNNNDSADDDSSVRCVTPFQAWIDLSDKDQSTIPTPKQFTRGQCVKVKEDSLANRELQGKHGRVLRELSDHRQDVWFDHLQAAQPIYNKHLLVIRRRDYDGSFDDPIRDAPDLRRPSSSARTNYERFQLVVLCDYQDRENWQYNGQCAVVEHLYNPTSGRIGLQLLSQPGDVFAVAPKHIRRPYETEHAPLVDHVAEILQGSHDIVPAQTPTPSDDHLFRAKCLRATVAPRCCVFGCDDMANVRNKCAKHFSESIATRRRFDVPIMRQLDDRYIHHPPILIPPDDAALQREHQRLYGKELIREVHAKSKKQKRRQKRRGNCRPTPIRLTSANNFRNWLPDSGATSHFVPHLSDLYDVEDCEKEVELADKSIVMCKKIGKCDLIFKDDESGKQMKYTLHDVGYIKGLRQRLFSYGRFFDDHVDHVITNTGTTIQLDFGSASITVPTQTPARYNAINTAVEIYSQVENISAVRSPPKKEDENAKSLPRIPLELAHQRLGHRAIRSVLSSSMHHAWDDYQVMPSSDIYCEGCKIGLSRSAPRGKRGTEPASAPFERIFIDIIPAPADDGLTPSTTVPCYLLVVDYFSRYSWFGDMKNYTTSEVTKCLEEYMNETRSLGRIKDIEYLRGDADSSFLSAEFQTWTIDNNIKADFAAPHHQEMNSIAEVTWRTIDIMGRTMQVHARVGNYFFGHARKYAVQILNRLCPKDLLDENGNPTTPYFKAFQRKPKIGHLRVFGCPVSFKRYNPSTPTGRLTKKQQVQKSSTRGIFIGLPPKQAGYLIYVEDRIGTANIIVSQDVTFDEQFRSAIACDVQPYQGAQHIRSVGNPSLSEFTDSATGERTGSVDDILHPPIGSVRGENVTDERDAQLTDPIEEVDERYFYDDIIGHKKTRDGKHRFQVKWNTGELTWEPEHYLREDAPTDFARYLRKSGLSELDQYAWAQDLGQEEDFGEDLPVMTQDHGRQTDDAKVDSNNEDVIEFEHNDAETPLEEEEHQQPIQSRANRYNLRSRPERAFSAYVKHEDAFDTEHRLKLGSITLKQNSDEDSKQLN